MNKFDPVRSLLKYVESALWTLKLPKSQQAQFIEKQSKGNLKFFEQWAILKPVLKTSLKENKKVEGESQPIFGKIEELTKELELFLMEDEEPRSPDKLLLCANCLRLAQLTVCSMDTPRNGLPLERLSFIFIYSLSYCEGIAEETFIEGTLAVIEEFLEISKAHFDPEKTQGTIAISIVVETILAWNQIQKEKRKRKNFLPFKANQIMMKLPEVIMIFYSGLLKSSMGLENGEFQERGLNEAQEEESSSSKKAQKGPVATTTTSRKRSSGKSQKPSKEEAKIKERVLELCSGLSWVVFLSFETLSHEKDSRKEQGNSKDQSINYLDGRNDSIGFLVYERFFNYRMEPEYKDEIESFFGKLFSENEQLLQRISKCISEYNKEATEGASQIDEEFGEVIIPLPSFGLILDNILPSVLFYPFLFDSFRCFLEAELSSSKEKNRVENMELLISFAGKLLTLPETKGNFFRQPIFLRSFLDLLFDTLALKKPTKQSKTVLKFVFKALKRYSSVQPGFESFSSAVVALGTCHLRLKDFFQKADLEQRGLFMALLQKAIVKNPDVYKIDFFMPIFKEIYQNIELKKKKSNWKTSFLTGVELLSNIFGHFFFEPLFEIEVFDCFDTSYYIQRERIPTRRGSLSLSGDKMKEGPSPFHQRDFRPSFLELVPNKKKAQKFIWVPSHVIDLFNVLSQSHYRDIFGFFINCLSHKDQNLVSFNNFMGFQVTAHFYSLQTIYKKYFDLFCLFTGFESQKTPQKDSEVARLVEAKPPMLYSYRETFTSFFLRQMSETGLWSFSDEVKSDPIAISVMNDQKRKKLVKELVCLPFGLLMAFKRIHASNSQGKSFENEKIALCSSYNHVLPASEESSEIISRLWEKFKTNPKFHSKFTSFLLGFSPLDEIFNEFEPKSDDPIHKKVHQFLKIIRLGSGLFGTLTKNLKNRLNHLFGLDFSLVFYQMVAEFEVVFQSALPLLQAYKILKVSEPESKKDRTGRRPSVDEETKGHSVVSVKEELEQCLIDLVEITLRNFSKIKEIRSPGIDLHLIPKHTGDEENSTSQNSNKLTQNDSFAKNIFTKEDHIQYKTIKTLINENEVLESALKFLWESLKAFEDDGKSQRNQLLARLNKGFIEVLGFFDELLELEEPGKCLNHFEGNYVPRIYERVLREEFGGEQQERLQKVFEESMSRLQDKNNPRLTTHLMIIEGFLNSPSFRCSDEAREQIVSDLFDVLSVSNKLQKKNLIEHFSIAKTLALTAMVLLAHKGKAEDKKQVSILILKLMSNSGRNLKEQRIKEDLYLKLNGLRSLFFLLEEDFDSLFTLKKSSNEEVPFTTNLILSMSLLIMDSDIHMRLGVLERIAMKQRGLAQNYGSQSDNGDDSLSNRMGSNRGSSASLNSLASNSTGKHGFLNPFIMIVALSFGIFDEEPSLRDTIKNNLFLKHLGDFLESASMPQKLRTSQGKSGNTSLDSESFINIREVILIEKDSIGFFFLLALYVFANHPRFLLRQVQVNTLCVAYFKEFFSTIKKASSSKPKVSTSLLFNSILALVKHLLLIEASPKKNKMALEWAASFMIPKRPGKLDLNLDTKSNQIIQEGLIGKKTLDDPQGETPFQKLLYVIGRVIKLNFLSNQIEKSGQVVEIKEKEWFRMHFDFKEPKEHLPNEDSVVSGENKENGLDDSSKSRISIEKEPKKQENYKKRRPETSKSKENGKESPKSDLKKRKRVKKNNEKNSFK